MYFGSVKPKWMCSVDGCTRVVSARGWCGTHYARWQKHGDVFADQRYQRRGEDDRFWKFVEKTADCWNWTGSKSPSGYGKFWADDGRTVRPHRWTYEHAIGPIPEGLQIDHLCRNRGCVRPDHLEATTGKVNTGRGERALRTHCPKGHEYTPENTYVIKPNKSLPHGGRACVACRKEHIDKYNAAQRQARRENPPTPAPLPTECRHGHPYTPENTYVTPAGKRACRACRNRASKAYLAKKSGA